MRRLILFVVLGACGQRHSAAPQATPSPEFEKRIEALERWSDELTIRLNEARAQLKADNERVAALEQWRQSIVPVIQGLSTRPVVPAPTPTLSADNGVKVVPIDHPLSCFSLKEVTLCASTLEICKGLAKSLKIAAGQCKPRDSAACYLETVVTSGIRRGWCFGDMATCRVARERDATSADSQDVSECVVERYER